MLSIRDALDTMLPAFVPMTTERVGLRAASGRVLAEDFVAVNDLPALANSAMDGYAVRAADARVAGARLPVHGESRAGGELPAALPAGHAMRIFTGAPLPEGADAVVMQEDTVRDGAFVVLNLVPRLGAHVRARGTDVRRGERMIEAGTPLGPGEIGLLAAQDQATLQVFRRPRVAILCTGDELRHVGAAARPGSIVNSNAYALHAAVAQSDAEPWVLPIARDDAEHLGALVREALTADVVLTVGGVSVGEYDLVAQTLAAEGVSSAFHKVAIKPGKPLLFGTRGRVPVIGLPGNPVSAQVTFDLFVRPGLLRMCGHRAVFPVPFEVELSAPFEHGPARTELARARLMRQGARWVAVLHSQQSSGALSSMTGVDALVVFPRGTTRFESGCRVWAIRPADTLRSPTPPIDDRSP